MWIKVQGYHIFQPLYMMCAQLIVKEIQQVLWCSGSLLQWPSSWVVCQTTESLGLRFFVRTPWSAILFAPLRRRSCLQNSTASRLRASSEDVFFLKSFPKWKEWVLWGKHEQSNVDTNLDWTCEVHILPENFLSLLLEGDSQNNKTLAQPRVEPELPWLQLRTVIPSQLRWLCSRYHVLLSTFAKRLKPDRYTELLFEKEVSLVELART